jgi:hypothetical protein
LDAGLSPNERYRVKFPGDSAGHEHTMDVELCQAAKPTELEPIMQPYLTYFEKLCPTISMRRGIPLEFAAGSK